MVKVSQSNDVVSSSSDNKVRKPITKNKGNKKGMFQLALTKLCRDGKKKYNAVLKVFKEATAAVLSTALNERRASTFIRGRSVEDRRSKAFDDIVPCPFKMADRHFAVWANNRLTVYLDQSFDNQLRPAFTFYNINNIPLKSEVDVYGNYVIKKWCIKSCSWLGNDEEVQIVIGDASGTVYRCDLQQRTCVNHWKAFDCGVKLMKTHVETNVFAVLGENNVVKFFAVEDLYEPDDAIFVGQVEIKPTIIDMAWDGDRLVCLTSDELIEINVDPKNCVQNLKTLKKTPKTDMKWKIFYTPKKETGNKFAKMKYYGPNCVLLQKKQGIEEHDLENKKLINNFDAPSLSSKCGFDLHPTKKLIAIGAVDGGMNIHKYPSGVLHSQLKKRGSGDDIATGVFWNPNLKNRCFMACGNRVMRFHSEDELIQDSKPADPSVYGNSALPFGVRPASMDQTNVDHDHRAYQWHWHCSDEISDKDQDKKEEKKDTELAKRIRKISSLDSRYEKVLKFILGVKENPKKRRCGDDEVRDSKKVKV